MPGGGQGGGATRAVPGLLDAWPWASPGRGKPRWPGECCGKSRVEPPPASGAEGGRCPGGSVTGEPSGSYREPALGERGPVGCPRETQTPRLAPQEGWKGRKMLREDKGEMKGHSGGQGESEEG